METKDVISFRRGGEVTSLDLNLAGAGETKVIGVESITVKKETFLLQISPEVYL